MRCCLSARLSGVLLLGLAALLVVVGLTPSWGAVGVWSALLLSATLLAPALGLAGWVMAVPLEGHWLLTLDGSPFVLWTPLVLGGILLPPPWHVRQRPHLLLLATASLLTGAVLTCSLRGSDVLYPALRASLSVGLLALLAGTLAGVMRRDPQAFWLLSLAAVLAALVATSVGLGTMAMSAARLSVGDNVRQIANAIGLALVLVGVPPLQPRGARASLLAARPLCRLVLLLGLMGLLGLTMSRGVLLAVAGAFGVAGAHALLLLRGSLPRRWVRDLALTLVGLGLAAGLTLLVLEPWLLHGQLTRRVLGALDTPGGDPRWRIWQAALGQMHGLDWWVGAGLGAFQPLAARGGWDYYAHSVAMDALVTLGWPGLGGLAGLFGVLGWRLWRPGELVGLGLWTYSVVAFATSGGLTTKAFWLTVGLLAGLAPPRQRGATRAAYRQAVP